MNRAQDPWQTARRLYSTRHGAVVARDSTTIPVAADSHPAQTHAPSSITKSAPSRTASATLLLRE